MQLATSCKILLLHLSCLMTSIAALSNAAEINKSITITKTENGFVFFEQDCHILSYQQQVKSLEGEFPRSNYVHPLSDLEGQELTEDFPQDHLHHRGIFWAWPQVWVGNQKVGDSWLAQNFHWEITAAKIVETIGEPPALQIALLWKSDQWLDGSGTPLPIVRESVTLQAFPRATDHRCVDFSIRLQALTEQVRIGGSENDKGYGGFSPRIRTPDDLIFTSAKGVATPQRVAVANSPWMDMSGTFGDNQQISGITVLCHPSSPGNPPPWILRQMGSMQNAVYPGRHPVTLPTDATLNLNYRLVIHRDRVTAAQIQQWYNDYSRSNVHKALQEEIP